MTSFQHVLVPVDFSEHAGPAIAQGAALANSCRARLTVLYVASTLIEPEVRDQLLARLYQAVEAHPAAGLRAEVEMVAGDPAREILTFARDLSVDLIVLGMRRHDVIERFFVPSVGETVARNAECPVLAMTEAAASRLETVRPAMDRVLCAVDLTESSAGTLEIAGDVARRMGSALTVVHVIDPATRRSLSPAHTAEASSWRDRSAVAAYGRLTSLLAHAPLDGVATRTLVAFGRVADQIVGAGSAADADLLVVGARPARVLGRAFLGPTARDVLRLAQRPVLLARARAAIADGRTPDPAEKDVLVGA